MKYWPLIHAWLWRRPARTLLAFIAVMLAFTLYGLALGEALAFRQAAAARHVNIGQAFLLGAMAVSAIGMALILFLVANATAQSVRLRMAEFGVLKAIGYSDPLILALTAVEVAVPCLAGAVAGLVAAPLLFLTLARLLPPLAVFPALAYTPAMLAAAAALAIFIGTASAIIPGMRIIRLDVAAALAGGLRTATTSRRDDDGVGPERAAATRQESRAETVLLPVLKADKRFLRQAIAVTQVGLSTLHYRIKGGLMVVAGIGTMTFVLLSFLSMAEGIRAAILDSGDPSRVILHAASTQWLDKSVVPNGTLETAATAPGVARGRDGDELVEAMDFHIVNTLTRRNNGEKGNTTIVGVGPRWSEMTPSFHLLSGRLPRSGARELIVGELARKKFSSLDAGIVLYNDLRWQVVGTFTTQDWWNGYLVSDIATLKAASRHTADNAVMVRLTGPQAFDAFQRFVSAKLPPAVVAERETDYYAHFWQIIPKLAFYVAYLLGGLIGTGAFAGTVHTMQIAVEERAREIAVLRALGFDGIAVATSAVFEVMLLTALGVFIGTTLVWLWMDGFIYNGASGVFRTVDFHLLLVAMGWGLAVALAGAFTPALRLARQTEIEALREV